MGEITTSVIIRTCNRPKELQRALDSVRKQTILPNEVIIVEDGPAHSYGTVRKFFDELNIVYRATEEHIGRANAANIGLQLASGTYINFLDDDDLFLPHHIETMLNTIMKKSVDAVHTPAIERKIIQNWYKDVIKYDVAFQKEVIFYRNMFPIQAVMFKRELFEKYGGMDPSLELLEDWDLWIRYGMHAKFEYVNCVTSIYHVPGDPKVYRQRRKQLEQYQAVIWNKYRPYMDENGYRPPGRLKRAWDYYKRKGFRETAVRIISKLLKE